jgi:hypothetical protein
MARRLRDSPQIQKLASDLKIRSTGDVIADILRFCGARIKSFMADFPDCDRPSQVLECVAAKLGMKFEEVRTDEDLSRIIQTYAQMGETGFADLEEEFRKEVYGVTIKRLKREPWEHSQVAVIDCRKSRAAREYFTKWHEVAHLLTATSQLRLSYRRTHCALDRKDPEELMMDLIAGHFGFRPPAGFEFQTDEVSFDAIEELRSQLCPEASKQSALISFVKFWPTPCLLITAKLGLRTRDQERLAQGSFDFLEAPAEELRAVHVTPSDTAREGDFMIPRNMRIPETSVIYRVFLGEVDYAEAEEDLSDWESSDGGRRPQQRILVKARSSWGSVEGLIIPITN